MLLHIALVKATAHGKRVNPGKARGTSKGPSQADADSIVATVAPLKGDRRGDDEIDVPPDSPGEGYELLRTGDVAQTFGVDVSTIRRWCTTLAFPCVVLPSGERRFDPKQIAQWWRDVKAAHGLK